MLLFTGRSIYEVNSVDVVEVQQYSKKMFKEYVTPTGEYYLSFSLVGDTQKKCTTNMSGSEAKACVKELFTTGRLDISKYSQFLGGGIDIRR